MRFSPVVYAVFPGGLCGFHRWFMRFSLVVYAVSPLFSCGLFPVVFMRVFPGGLRGFSRCVRGFFRSLCGFPGDLCVFSLLAGGWPQIMQANLNTKYPGKYRFLALRVDRGGGKG